MQNQGKKIKRMALVIKINNLNKKRKIDKNAIKRIAAKVLKSFGKKSALVDITFVTNRKIKVLNKRYMKKDGATDVLSFVLEEKKLVGDVYISSDMAKINAGKFSTSFKEEILLYTIHGTLHLVGFGDKTIKEKKKIRKLENRFLKI